MGAAYDAPRRFRPRAPGRTRTEVGAGERQDEWIPPAGRGPVLGPVHAQSTPALHSSTFDRSPGSPALWRPLVTASARTSPSNAALLSLCYPSGRKKDSELVDAREDNDHRARR